VDIRIARLHQALYQLGCAGSSVLGVMNGTYVAGSWRKDTPVHIYDIIIRFCQVLYKKEVISFKGNCSDANLNIFHQ